MSMLAKDLRIGDKIRKPGTSDETVMVRELNELCPALESPHVHALTSGGPFCFGFDRHIGQGKSDLRPPKVRAQRNDEVKAERPPKEAPKAPKFSKKGSKPR